MMSDSFFARNLVNLFNVAVGQFLDLNLSVLSKVLAQAVGLGRFNKIIGVLATVSHGQPAHARLRHELVWSNPFFVPP